MLACTAIALIVFGVVAAYLPNLEVLMNYSNSGEPVIRQLEPSTIRGFFSGMYLACVVALVLLLAFALNKTRVVSIIATVFLVISLAVTALGFILNYQHLVYEADFIISLVAAGVGILSAIIAAISGIVHEGNRDKARIKQLEAKIEELESNLRK